MQLLVVKDELECELHEQGNVEGLSYGAAILKYFVLPWANSQLGTRVDSYFPSFQVQKRRCKYYCTLFR